MELVWTSILMVMCWLLAPSTFVLWSKPHDLVLIVRQWFCFFQVCKGLPVCFCGAGDMCLRQVSMLQPGTRAVLPCLCADFCLHLLIILSSSI